tara:strand:+ start:889 stop:1116 length:228 start_codon:yes stop_codon:yes gene_type:complete
MRYQIKRECWNDKTYNGYEDAPYWRIDTSGLSFGLTDEGKLWPIGQHFSITNTNISDIDTIIKECKLQIKIILIL